MFKILLKFLIIIFLSVQLLKAEIINKIEITGNNKVSDETIKIYGEIEINKDLNEADLNKILNNLYSTNFFEDISINLSNNTLKISLKEYPIVNQLILNGEPSKRISDEIKRLISLKEKRSFIRSYLTKDIDIIKSIYSTLGYNNSKVEVKVKEIDKSNFDIFIDIERGNLTKISSISFIGDKKIRDRRLRDVIASEEDKFYKFISSNTKFSQRLVNLDIRLLTNYYKSQGFYDVSISSNSAEINDQGNVDLIYSIDAGNRYRISKIFTNADSVFDANIFFPLKKSYEKFIGEYYSPFKVKKLLEDVDELIADNNLQFVEHNVEEIIQGNQIQIKFNIFESEKILVERINILGNNVTNEAVIRGELLLDEGDPFTELNLKKSVAKIKSRNIFNSVKSDIKEGTQKNLKIINIEVEEKPTGEVTAGAGVGSNGGTFAIGVSENNWLGQGKKLNLELDVDEESIKGQLNYTDPNYNFLGNSINYYISSQSNDKPEQGYENTVMTGGLETTFEQYKDIYATLGLSASFDDLKTENNASDSLKKQSGNFSEIATAYGFKYDGRNQAFMPTSGSVVSLYQSIPLYADKNFISNTISSSSYKALSENVIGAGKFYFSSVNGLGDDDVRLSKRKGLSTSRLRGFAKGKVGPIDGSDHIGGNYVSAVNLEASFPNLLPESYRADVGLFIDAGNVWGVDYDSTLNESNKIRSSTGAAVSWLSPVGPMTFIFSTNLSKANTDETENFNFQLGTTF